MKMLWGLISSLITWAIVIAGWMVIADQQNARELRKDRATRLNSIRDSLESLADKAVCFHTSDAFDELKLHAIVHGIRTLQRELSFLRFCGFVAGDFDDLIIKFRQACTANNADRSSFSTQEMFGQIVGDILFHAQQIDDYLIESLTIAFTANKSVAQSLTDIAAPPWQRFKRWWALMRDSTSSD